MVGPVQVDGLGCEDIFSLIAGLSNFGIPDAGQCGKPVAILEAGVKLLYVLIICYDVHGWVLAQTWTLARCLSLGLSFFTYFVIATILLLCHGSPYCTQR